MKTIIILYLLFPLALLSQELEKTFQPHLFSENTAIEVVDSSIFINIHEDSPFDSKKGKHKIYKLDFQLNIIDSLDLTGFDTPWSSFFNYVTYVSRIGKDSLSVVLFNRRDTTLPSGQKRVLTRSHVVIFDVNLNTLSAQTLGTFHEGFAGYVLDRIQNHLYLTGIHYDYVGDSTSPFVMRLELSGNPIDTGLISNSSHFPWNQGLTIFSHIEKIGGQFVVGIEDLSKYGHCLTVLDSNLSYSDKILLYPAQLGIPNLYLGNEGLLKNLGDTALYMINSGFTLRQDPNAPWNNTFYHFAVVKFNSALSPIEIDTLTFSGFHHEFESPAILNPRGFIDFGDVSNPDSVIFSSAGKLQHNPGLIDSNVNELYLYSYNLTNGTLNWQKTLNRSSGTNQYVQSAYIGDGKSVFVFNEYDWNTDPTLHQKVVILIMNEHGDVIGQREFTQSLTPIVLYPNPAIDRIRIKVPLELHPTSYQIISVDGRVVDSGTWESPELTVEHLPAGKYYLKVFDEGRLVAIEGFVKN